MRNRLTFGILVLLSMTLVLSQNCSKGYQSTDVSNSSLGAAPSPSPNNNPNPNPNPAPGPGPAPMPAPVSTPAVSGTFAALTQSGTPAARWGAANTSIGSKLFIWGGWPGSSANLLNDGALYDSANSTWTSISGTGAPEARNGARAIWTGTRILVWGGLTTSGTVNTGAYYDPANNSWAPFPQANSIPSRSFHAMAWMNGRLFVWGGFYMDGNTFGQRPDGYVYDPVTQMWSQISMTGGPAAQQWVNAVFTGSKILIFGGCTPYTNTLYQYDPALNQWSTLNAVGAPPVRCGNSLVWTGKEMISFGGGNGNDVGLNDTGVYDPALNTWRLFPGPSGVNGRIEHAAAWVGNQMIIWGGYSAPGRLGTASGNTFK